MKAQLHSLALVLAASGCAALMSTMVTTAAPIARHDSAVMPPAALDSAAAPPGASAGWWSEVQEDIAASEYEITWQSETVLADLPEAWQAPNRAHNFRAYFTERGIRVVPRTEEVPLWEWGLALNGYGRGSKVWPIANSSVRPAGNRIEYTRGGIVEWYENAPRGLEQGFTLSRPPGEAGVDSEAQPEPRTVPRGLEQRFALASRPEESHGEKMSRPEELRGDEVSRPEELHSGEGMRGEDGSRGDAVETFEDIAPPRGSQDNTLDPTQRDRAVFVQIELTGDLDPVFATDGQAIDFRTPGGVNVVRFAQLRVTDASGRALPAWMEGFAAIGARTVRIVFDDTDAAYPVRVDPLATSPAWTAESDQAYADFGWSVATAGDVNGDGYSDVIVGAPGYNNGQTDEGRAYVYLGSASGLASSPAWTAESNQASANFGYSVSTAGDVNGDGYSDVIVGASRYNNGHAEDGRAYVYLGSPSGLATSAAWTADGDQAAAFGVAVATAGDVNGDGYSDVIVGESGYSNGQTFEGRAYVYLGSASGLASTPAWTAESDQASAHFGLSVATAGDVNVDGYSDVIVGAKDYSNGQPNEGAAYVYLGSASGLAASPAWTAESNKAYAYFGNSVATAGDINGDGYADVIVGAYNYDNLPISTGQVYVYLGSASGLASSPAWTAESDQASAYFGRSVSTAGDVNGDGYSDVIVGSLGERRAYVYLGSASGLPSSPAWTPLGDVGSAFGYSVATAGDVNGDGYSDVIVGGYYYTNGQTQEGRAYVYLGSPSGLASASGWTAESDQAAGQFGRSVATAGDVNGDGYADVIVGAEYYDNGQADEGRAFVYLGSATGLATSPAWTAESDQAGAYFGRSVSTAGDVNGDGYSDVIVGAWAFDNGETNEGRAYAYLGSVSGLASSPAWTAESNQANAFFGRSVATAGDVNGDGYSDVIVGAEYYDNDQTNEGRAYVYLGSVSGLSASPVWTAEGDQANAAFGASVSTAGDVNGDGYSDVIVGAPTYDNGETDEGRAYVYLGSASGLAASPAWTAEGNQATALFGRSVATAGDVNGDGYSDVIVGAYLYDNGETDEGRAYLYLGSASGLAASPAWTAESDQAGAGFGYSVATAGDINGDGYSDVIVGAYLYDNGQTDEGRAYLYLGSASGLSPSPAWTAESDQAAADFGISVAMAGDVNGDGYSDVIVGAHLFDNVETDEGRAYVYYGNGGRGASLRPQQRRADDMVPIAQLGTSKPWLGFRLAALGRTPFGRGKLKLEREVKPLGTSFNGMGTQASASWMDTGTAGAALDELVTSLAYQTVYHWRVRLRYHPVTTPFQQRSRWLTVPWNGWQEADLRTPAPPPSASGRVPDGSTGSPLRVTRSGGANITLTWGASCLATDTDYTIYEGTIGSYYSHAARFCSTGGATTRTFVPASGSRYYLVVPHNAAREGSYGTNSSGAERPPAAVACMPQAIGSCP